MTFYALHVIPGTVTCFDGIPGRLTANGTTVHGWNMILGLPGACRALRFGDLAVSWSIFMLESEIFTIQILRCLNRVSLSVF